MSNIKFLSKDSYTREVQKIIEDQSDLNIAVSYWGNRRLSNLGLTERVENGNHNIRVICDLFHIACRHEPIEWLHSKGVPLKYISGLHAKVWISNSSVIIGSANSSWAALPSKIKAGNSNEEAGIWTTDKNLIRDAQVWFDDLWCGENSRHIEERELNKKKRDHTEEKRKNINKGSRGTPPRDLKPFSHYVGEESAAAYLRRLAGLGFKPSNKGAYTRMYRDIEDVETLSDDLIDAVRELVESAEGVDRRFLRGPVLIPPGFENPSDKKRKVLHKKIAELIEELKGQFLWIERGESGITANYRLSLASERTPNESVSILSLMENRVYLAGNR